VTVSDPRSPVAEAYRVLRTNLAFSSLDEPVRSIIVTSPAPQEEKSTTLANLAVVEAQAGNRVLLIDCDLRQPMLHQLFGASNETGITNLLLRDLPPGELPAQSTGVDGLHLLPSGPLPPNPAELLGSRRMAELIARLKDEADLLLFDAPPVVAVTDAAVLSTKVDGVLLVVSAGRTRREQAHRARELLGNVNARILGVVMTNVRAAPGVYGY
jgi:non-specific protein-tyrosine kinase